MSWETSLGHEEQVRAWVSGGKGRDPLSIVRIEESLVQKGVKVRWPPRVRDHYTVRSRLRLPY
ncbi:hypothetical protein GCM10029976_028710 [Kribbella albertanoniae]